MRNILLIFTLAMLLSISQGMLIKPDQINNSLPFPSITMDEDANITLDGGHLVGSNISALANPSTDSDIYVFAALWDSITVAQWDNGTLISWGTNDSDALNDALDACDGGRIVIKDDMYIVVPLTIHSGFTEIELLLDVVITASSSMAQMILIDPPAANASMYNVAVSGGTLDSNGQAAIGIEVKGHYPDDKLTWGVIKDITIRDCTDSAVKLNSTTFLRINELTTINNSCGIKFAEACINTHISAWQSYDDEYGAIIGSTYPAPHQRCEGISFIDPVVLGSTYCDIYMYEALQTTINDGILDYSSGNSIYMNGNVEWTFVDNTYISPMASSSEVLYGRGLVQRGSANHIYLSNCALVGSYYYAIDLINATYVSVSNCMFYENGRMDSDGGDISNYGSDYVSLIGNNFATVYDPEKYNYVETGSGLQLNTSIIGNHYTNRLITNGGLPVYEHNSIVY